MVKGLARTSDLKMNLHSQKYLLMAQYVFGEFFSTIKICCNLKQHAVQDCFYGNSACLNLYNTINIYIVTAFHKSEFSVKQSIF